MTDKSEWLNRGRLYDYEMPPPVSMWMTWPAIRHIRTLRAKWAVESWYARGPGSIGIRTGYDNWVLVGMWNGWERTE
jgi:hypothetical protein